jgi:predicted MPP superfamily phosphohydrolase
MSAGMAGVIDSYSDIKVPIIKVAIPNLPGPLFGLRIAHLSDLHLGYYIHLRDLQRAVEKIREQRPDMVLFTGDISDDLTQLPQVLDMVDSLQPRFGTYASVGNHEYYRGIQEVLSTFEKAPFPMLINRHVNINIGGINVYLGGADDPRHLRQDYSDFLRNTINYTMNAAPPNSFKILMSHRPEALNHASECGIDLVLAGHTHGGQVGLAGKSAFESVFPEKYLWGLYKKKATTLYTSGGMGHWFPFRLGIPTEAPIIVLEKAPESIS